LALRQRAVVEFETKGKKKKLLRAVEREKHDLSFRSTEAQMTSSRFGDGSVSAEPRNFKPRKIFDHLQEKHEQCVRKITQRPHREGGVIGVKLSAS